MAREIAVLVHALIGAPGVRAHMARLAAMDAVLVFGLGVLSSRGELDWRVFALMATAYLASAAFNVLDATRVLSRARQRATKLFLASAFLGAAVVLALTAVAGADPLPGLAIGMVAGFVCREAGFLDAARGAHESVGGAKATVSVAALSAVQPIIIGASLAVAGLAAGVHPATPFALAALGGVVMVRSVLAEPAVASGSLKAKAAPLPGAVKRQCALSAAFNAVSLVKSRLLVPLYAVSLARTFGMGEDLLPTIGTVVGVISAFGAVGHLAKRGAQNAGVAPKSLMLVGSSGVAFFVGLWGAIDLALMTGRPGMWPLVAVGLAIMAQIVFTQFWNVGFFSELTRKAEAAEAPKDRNVEYVKLWQTCKNASAPVGFVVAAFFADSVVANAGVALLLAGAVCAVATGLYALADLRSDIAADTAR